MTTLDKDMIKRIFLAKELIVRDISIDEDNDFADAYITVNDIGTYGIEEIQRIIDKIKDMRDTLINRGVINDIRMGDLYQGSWRVLLFLMSEEEIEKWEENALKSS